MPSLILSGKRTNARLEEHHLIVSRHGEEEPATPPRRIPLHDVDRVVVIGQPSVSIPALFECMRRGIPVAFLASYGRWMGTLCPDNNLNAERRVRQYERARDDTVARTAARALIEAKLNNARRVLQRLAANRSETNDPDHVAAVKELEHISRKTAVEPDLDAMRGYEGLGAARYFARLKGYFPDGMPFPERSRRPPRDPANALLSWTYMIVLSEIDACARAHGLDTAIGFLHRIDHGRPSLSLDLLEPFRPALCDLLVLDIVNHRRLTEADFEADEEQGGYRMRHDAKKRFFTAYEAAMTRQFTPRKGEEHTDFRREIERAVLSIVRLIETGEPGAGFFSMP